MSKIEELGMNAANNAAGQILGLAFGGIQDARQRKQAKALAEIQGAENRKQADYSQQLALDMWNKTNYEATVEHMKEAGINPGLMYGAAGGGGATGATAAPVSGANPGDPNAGVGMGIQLGLMQAQKENIEADTENKKADAAQKTSTTTGTDFQNELNRTIGIDAMWKRYEWANDMLETQQQRAIADWESYNAAGYKGKTFNDPNSPVVKALEAGFNKTVEEAKIAKTNNNIARAEQVIKEFQADLAKQGIAPDTPWYVKIVADLLDKIGLSPIKAIQKAGGQ